MRKREIDRYRMLLESQLSAIVGQGEQTVHQMVGTGSEEIPDPNDRASLESDRNWSLRLRDRDRRLAAKIEAALERLEHGTFGTCESCGRPISAARLRARPVTTRPDSLPSREPIRGRIASGPRSRLWRRPACSCWRRSSRARSTSTSTPPPTKI